MSAHPFTIDDIKALAELERDMDAGKYPFVVLDGSRLAVPPETMEELKLTSGQSVTPVIFQWILRTNIAFCQAKIAIKKAQSAQNGNG